MTNWRIPDRAAMADKNVPPQEVELKAQFAKEAQDPSMLAYLRSLGKNLFSSFFLLQNSNSKTNSRS